MYPNFLAAFPDRIGRIKAALKRQFVAASGFSVGAEGERDQDVLYLMRAHASSP
jgi:hypothetical protein